MPVRLPRLALMVTLLLGAAMSGCGASDRPTGVATNPPPGENQPDGSSGGGTAAGVQTSGTRTVLSPIGLNIRGEDAPTAAPVGTAGRGTLLTIIGHSDRNGGWYRIRGQTTTGWISADPDLSAPGHFSMFDSDQLSFSALYPDQWSFANEPGDVVFKPQSGPQAIVVRPAGSVALLGPAGRAGYSAATQAEVVVCGTTGNVVGYDRQGSGSPASATAPATGTGGASGQAAPAPAAPGEIPSAAPPVVSAPPLAHFAQLRLRLDAAHALELDYNYDAADQLQAFKNFYNSVTVPFPQCMQTASPEPTPPARAPGAPL
ncbi:MAG: SH3 domain-containing protein [Candidatus Dormibacteria bacterium]